MSLGEIRKGIEGVADPAFRQALTDWLEVELPNYFVGRLLGIDEAVADRCCVKYRAGAAGLKRSMRQTHGADAKLADRPGRGRAVWHLPLQQQSAVQHADDAPCDLRCRSVAVASRM